MGSCTTKPTVIHILDRLSVGGMESVVVNLIEHSCSRYSHSVICLSGWAEGPLFERLTRLGVPVQSVNKQPGKDFGAYFRLWRTLRDSHPDIVHTYNIGTIDASICARLAGVRHIVHAEHGRDATDPHGRNAKYRWLRKLLSPMISTFVPVSKDLARWLREDIGIPEKKIQLIYNGIDINLYRSRDDSISPLPAGFVPPEGLVIGSVGRLDPVKAYDLLLDAFAQLVAQKLRQHERCNLRLVIIGNGQEYDALDRQIRELEITPWVWLSGERDDVPQLLRAMDVYVCSSIAEGMALTILEAMACGLPVVATRVGGNPELVVHEETGQLIPASDASALTHALQAVLLQPEHLRRQGEAGRCRVEALFSIDKMVAAYCELYDELLRMADTIVEAR